MKHVARSALIVAVFFGLDKILGLIRQLIIARQFALSYELDVFNAANNIPDLLSSLISGGALGVALIPVLSEYLEQKGRPEAWNLFSRILNIAFIVTAIFAAIIAIFAPWFVNQVIAPGFPDEQKILTIELMRLDLVAIIIFSISGLVMAGLQANQHFLFPAIAPALYNIGQIFGASVLSPSSNFEIGPISLPAFGLGIHGLVYGVVIGALLHLAIQIPGLIRFDFRWTPKIDLKNPGVQQVLRLLGPRVLTMFFIQLFFIVRDNLASSLGEGAVTALNLGWFIMQVPETLLGSAIAITILPTISELFALDDKHAFQNTINTAIRVLLSLTIPSAVLLAVGVRPLVQVAFNFDAAGTEMVVWATRAYLFGLAGHALLEIASRSFYAQQNAKIPLYAAAYNAIAYFIMANVFARQWGHTGIAIANSIAFTTEALLLLWLLHKRYPGILNVLPTLLRSLIASAVVATGLYFAMEYVPMNSLFVSLGGMILGMLIVIPVIWQELRLLLKLEKPVQP